MSPNMRVLVLSPRPCLPTNTGAKLREFHMLRHLAKHASLHLLAFHTSGQPLALDFATVQSFLRPPRYTFTKIISSIVSGTPLSILNYRSEPLAQALIELLTNESFDCIWLESIHMAAYLPELDRLVPALPRIWNWHNIESELLFRYASQGPTPAHAWYARKTAGDLSRLEKRILSAPSSLHLVCSQREIEAISATSPSARLAVLPNGVDACAFTPAPLEGSQNLLFVGSLDYPPNINGLLYFTSEVWPAIHSRHPQARLQIVGSNPTPAITRLGTLPGIELIGPVPLVEPFYASARLAIVPLFTGGGTRLKILEAFAAGVPVVSSTLGIEGIDALPGEDFLTADSTPAWIDAVSRLLSDPAVANTLAASALNLARSRYDWGILCQPLPQWLDSLD